MVSMLRMFCFFKKGFGYQKSQQRRTENFRKILLGRVDLFCLTKNTIITWRSSRYLLGYFRIQEELEHWFRRDRLLGSWHNRQQEQLMECSNQSYLSSCPMIEFWHRSSRMKDVEKEKVANNLSKVVECVLELLREWKDKVLHL